MPDFPEDIPVQVFSDNVRGYSPLVMRFLRAVTSADALRLEFYSRLRALAEQTDKGVIPDWDTLSGMFSDWRFLTDETVTALGQLRDLLSTLTTLAHLRKQHLDGAKREARNESYRPGADEVKERLRIVRNDITPPEQKENPNKPPDLTA